MSAPPLTAENPTGLLGIDFVEFASPRPDELHALFVAFGFSRVARHERLAIDLYEQNDIHFLLNRAPGTFGDDFARRHGPSICSMAWRAKSASAAREVAVSRGARPATGDLGGSRGPLPAIYGIGDSLLYFVDGHEDPKRFERMGFVPLAAPERVPDKGFVAIDHLTNNVEKGTMGRWADFYKSIFGFTEVRYFDIRGAKTGLTSYALRSPCGTFCIPINEATDQKSQINEFLEEYKGPGVQHLAFLTRDILASLRALEGTPIHFLDMDEEYYASVFQRVPGVTEDRAEIQARHVLVDGDEEGYLLQIFTKPVVGPIFIEIIQRKNHHAFGEGNFGALFRSIERDQARRGYLDDKPAG